MEAVPRHRGREPPPAGRWQPGRAPGCQPGQSRIFLPHRPPQKHHALRRGRVAAAGCAHADGGHGYGAPPLHTVDQRPALARRRHLPRLLAPHEHGVSLVAMGRRHPGLFHRSGLAVPRRLEAQGRLQLAARRNRLGLWLSQRLCRSGSGQRASAAVSGRAAPPGLQKQPHDGCDPDGRLRLAGPPPRPHCRH